MSMRSLLGAFVFAAGVSAAVAAKMISDQKKEEAEEQESLAKEMAERPVFDMTGRSQEVVEICGVYPYLNPDFVEGILARSGEMNAMYEEDTLITVTHRAKFADEENRKNFELILSAGGYVCEKDGSLTVRAARKMFVENDAILSDVLNVANQAAALSGSYEDFTTAKS